MRTGKLAPHVLRRLGPHAQVSIVYLRLKIVRQGTGEIRRVGDPVEPSARALRFECVAGTAAQIGVQITIAELLRNGVHHGADVGRGLRLQRHPENERGGDHREYSFLR